MHGEFRKFALFVRIWGWGFEMVFVQLFKYFFFFVLNAAFAAELSIFFSFFFAAVIFSRPFQFFIFFYISKLNSGDEFRSKEFIQTIKIHT